jgi:hypothetical protein
VTPVAVEMIDDLLRMDADFFTEGHMLISWVHLPTRTE